MSDLGYFEIELIKRTLILSEETLEEFWQHLYGRGYRTVHTITCISDPPSRYTRLYTMRAQNRFIIRKRSGGPSYRRHRLPYPYMCEAHMLMRPSRVEMDCLFGGSLAGVLVFRNSLAKDPVTLGNRFRAPYKG